LHAATAELLGEFDDQDGVLGGEADEHDQADLTVDVVFEAAQRLRAQPAEHGYRHAQHDDEGQYPAFVLGGEGEEDHQQAQAEEAAGLARRLDLFEREAGPEIGEARGQYLVGQLLHGVNCLAAGEAGAGGTVNLGRAEDIVVRNNLGGGGLVHGDQVRERDHSSAVGAHVILADIGGRIAVLGRGLDVDAVDAVVEIEVVDVDRAHVALQRIGDLAERHAQAFGLVAI